MFGRISAAGAAFVLALALAPAAIASTVNVDGATLRIDGDPSVNDLTITYVEDAGKNFFHVAERGQATAQPGAGCARDDLDDIICEDVGGAITKYAVALGGGDDALRISALFASGAIDGGPGDDSVIAGDSATAAYPGHDVFHGGDGNDAFYASEGDDTFHGGAGNDNAFGGAGTDVLHGEGGQDRLVGDEGDDRLFGGADNDVVEGGAGNDPDVDGGPGDDEVRGDAGDDIVRGGDGDDKLEYHFSLTGTGQGAGRDDLSGGPGRDAVDYDDHSGGVVLTLDDQANDGSSGGGDNVRTDIEVLAGGQGNDTITGTDAANVLSGNGGDDTIDGLGGDDLLDGGSGKDKLYGRAGADKLEGSSDEDLLDGGPGRDIFEGDPPCTIRGCSGGSDEIHARDGEEDLVNCGVGADRVFADQFDVVATDFQQGCETVERLTVDGRPVAPGGQVTNPQGGAPDPLRLTVPRTTLRKLVRSGLRFSTGCAGPCRISVQLKRGRTVVGKTSRSMLKAGRTSMTLRVAKRHRRSLGRLRRAKLTLVVVKRDASGKAQKQTKVLNLKR